MTARREIVHVPEIVELANGVHVDVSSSRTETVTVHHQSISPELMNAQIEIAKALHVTPAKERTAQVKVLSVAAGFVITVGVAGAVFQPLVAGPIVGIVGVLSAVVGSVYVADKYISKKSP